MKKLINGIVEFRQNVLPGYREKFANLAQGQSPDSLFITCSDSRVAPNWFASTDPGDLFVVRNVGNLIPVCKKDGHSSADESEAAAIEFALLNLKITDIVVCGHSDCGAMHAIVNGRDNITASNLKAWLRHGEGALKNLPSNLTGLAKVNRLSQLNVLHQLEHLRSYPMVKERIENKTLRLHGWWFELKTADVHAYEETFGKFVPIDQEEAHRILSRLE